MLVAGILIFSGVLYAYTLTYVKILGAIVPIGGISMLAGWICFAVAAMGATNGNSTATPDEVTH